MSIIGIIYSPAMRVQTTVPSRGAFGVTKADAVLRNPFMLWVFS